MIRNVYLCQKNHFTLCKKFKCRCLHCLWKIFTKGCQWIHVGIMQCPDFFFFFGWMSRFLKSSLTGFLVLFVGGCGFFCLCFFFFLYFFVNYLRITSSMNWLFSTELNVFTGNSVMWEHPSCDWLMQADVIFRLLYVIFVMVIYVIFNWSSCIDTRINGYACVGLTNIYTIFLI